MSRGGVILVPPPKKVPSREIKGKRWCFTINNWNVDNVGNVERVGVVHQIICAKEVGESGTPHLQGYVEFKTEKRMETIKKLFDCNHMHLEKARGKKEDNIRYCSKEGSDVFIRTFPLSPEELKAQRLKDIEEEQYSDVIWRPWQQEVLDLVDDKPDPRKIIWLWEPTGNVGKSYLQKYLALKKKVIIENGKSADVLNQVLVALETHDPTMVIMDVPRSQQDYFNYGVIEKLKDGCVYSGKYEGGQILLKNLHVVVTANTMPLMDKMSADRWMIGEIVDNDIKWDDDQ